MSYQDKKCVCRDCKRAFTFSAALQREFEINGFDAPNRCPKCQETRYSKRDHSKSDTRAGAAVVKCASCGKDANLPFKPTGKKPVYCSACFRSKAKADLAPENRTILPVRPKKVVPQMVEIVVEDTVGTASFADFELDARLERAIVEAGFEVPTPVQAATIPVALEKKDLIGTAQTGTGKTAAFVLPILQHLLTNPATDKRCTRVIVLTPTRELAEQISDSFKLLGRYTKIKVATVYGGVGMFPQERALRNGTEVIVACPGRLQDHIDRGNTNFGKVEKLILDEADRMLDMGFLPPIRKIISYLPDTRHSMLFSATFAQELERLISDTLKDPQRIDVGFSAPAKTVAHALYPCPQHLKTSMVLSLLEKTEVDSVLIFTRTKHRANRVAQQMQKAGYRTTALHADKSQSQRQIALDSFRSGRCQILVATDIAARGLDVNTISHVINYDIPDSADTYIHRIGRTGRAEREGDAITLITKGDSAVVWDIERTLGSTIERKVLEDFDYNVPVPEGCTASVGAPPARKPRFDASRNRSKPSFGGSRDGKSSGYGSGKPSNRKSPRKSYAG